LRTTVNRVPGLAPGVSNGNGKEANVKPRRTQAVGVSGNVLHISAGRGEKLLKEKSRGGGKGRAGLRGTPIKIGLQKKGTTGHYRPRGILYGPQGGGRERMHEGGVKEEKRGGMRTGCRIKPWQSVLKGCELVQRGG